MNRDTQKKEKEETRPRKKNPSFTQKLIKKKGKDLSFFINVVLFNLSNPRLPSLMNSTLINQIISGLFSSNTNREKKINRETQTVEEGCNTSYTITYTITLKQLFSF